MQNTIFLSNTGHLAELGPCASLVCFLSLSAGVKTKTCDGNGDG